MIVFIKFSLTVIALIVFQSVASWPRIKHTDSKPSLTAAGGLFIALNSTKCCFLIDLTAKIIRRNIN
jgi:hypothetical protein